MGPLQAIRTCYIEKYATFSGRAPRSEYWFFQLFLIFAAFGVPYAVAAIGISAGLFPEKSSTLTVIVLCAMAIYLASLLPAFAVAVRRLHDVNCSGLFLLIHLVPFGGIALVIWMCISGTDGPNDFGEDPYAVARTLV
jgi:uncharacterized membrane protein YhaH (DUF805 family)